MNYDTINYAYLAGFLEAELKSLAHDRTFAKMKDSDDKRTYINKLIKNATDAAKEYDAKLKAM